MATILVIDDDPDFIEITRLVLLSKGYTVEVATGGDSALRLMRATPPDLVLLDVMMAGVLDGLHIARLMNDDPTLHHIPVIMISSITASDQAGLFPTDEYIPIDSWISKPVQPQQLLAAVARFLGTRRAT